MKVIPPNIEKLFADHCKETQITPTDPSYNATREGFYLGVMSQAKETLDFAVLFKSQPDQGLPYISRFCLQTINTISTLYKKMLTEYLEE